MRYLRHVSTALLVAVLITACGTTSKDIVKTSGTVNSRAAVTVTSATTPESQSPTPTTTVELTSTPTPTQQPTMTPTPQPTPTPAPQAVTIVSQGFGQPADSREVGWAFVVQNPNSGLAIESSQYQIAFSDASGTIIDTESGYLELLLPSEKTAVAGQAILPEGATASKMDVTFSEGDASSFDVTETFKTDKITYLADEYFPRITGIVTNPYTSDLQEVRLSAVAYDAKNQIIGSGYTFLNFIPAGGSSGASMSMTSSAVPDHVELYASISGLTTLENSASEPDTGEALVIAKQGYGVSQALGEVGYGFIVENPNADQSFERSLFQVAVYDDSGAVVGTDSGYIDLILGGEKLGIGGEIFVSDDKVPTRVVVQVLRGDSSSVAATPLFATENVKYVSDDYSPKVTGAVKNLTDKTLKDIRVSAIAYNEAGEITGGGFSYLDFVPANAQSAAEVSVSVDGAPASVELYPTVTSLSMASP